MVLLAFLYGRILIVRNMHLSADAVDPGETVGFPDSYPMNETLQLSVVIPIRLEVVVIYEES